MKLSEIAMELAGTKLTGDADIGGLCADSRVAGEGDLFFCFQGTKTDAHNYAAEAVARGAAAVLCEREIPVSCPQLIVEDAREGMARACAAFCGHPERAMRMVGVTGTNGKTTTAAMIANILNEAGVAAVVFVVGNKTDLVDDRQVKAEDAESWAHARNYSFFECSAKSGDGVKHLFEEMAKAIVVTKEIKFENPKPNPKQGQSSCC